MPHLRNFLKNNGTILTNHHTPLISHTATDILTSLTGVYGDRHGVPVSNSFRYFNPDGTSNPGVSFAYWTDPSSTPLQHADRYHVQHATAEGKNAPAPWAAFHEGRMRRGAVATANTILENIVTDIPTVFGKGSPQRRRCWQFRDRRLLILSASEFIARSGARYARRPMGESPISCPMNLVGTPAFAPVWSRLRRSSDQPRGPRSPTSTATLIQDPQGHVGSQDSTAWPPQCRCPMVAALQEHGVPSPTPISRTLTISTQRTAYGPARGICRALAAYDDCLQQVFHPARQDGITRTNTLLSSPQ